MVYYSIFQPEHKELMEELGRAVAQAMGEHISGGADAQGEQWKLGL